MVWESLAEELSPLLYPWPIWLISVCLQHEQLAVFPGEALACSAPALICSPSLPPYISYIPSLFLTQTALSKMHHQITFPSGFLVQRIPMGVILPTPCSRLGLRGFVGAEFVTTGIKQSEIPWQPGYRMSLNICILGKNWRRWLLAYAGDCP